MKKKICGVYALIDPNDNTVKYIGGSTDCEKRFLCHINIKRQAGNQKRKDWIQFLYNNNQKPVFKILEECDPTELNLKEKFYIDQYAETILNMKNYGAEGKPLFCKDLKTQEIKFYQNSNEAVLDGFSRAQIYLVCAGKIPYHKNHVFWYDGTKEPIYSKKYSINGVSQSLKSWARDYNIKYELVVRRISWGWDLEKALNQPSRKKNKSN